MKTTWILIAHRGGARIFENRGPGKGLNLLEEIPHPEGRLKSKDLGTDEPGRSSGRDGARQTFEQEQEPSAHVTEVFAKRLAGILEEGRIGRRFGGVVLVAEARFLGILRSALSSETSALVTATVNKDLGHVESHEVPKHLGDAVRL